MKYEIVPMDKGHLEEVVALERCSFSTPWTKQQLEEVLYQDNSSFLVAQGENAEVLGYAGLTVVLDEGYINNVAVFPQYQKQGVAGAILDVFCNFAQGNLLFLTLEVRESNVAAVSLYTSRGFEEAGVRRNYYDHPKENALILSRFFKENMK